MLTTWSGDSAVVAKSTNSSDPRLTTPRLTARARLDGESSLAVFRTVLAALAHPGRVAAPLAPVPESIPAALLPALALADLALMVAVLEPGADGPPTDPTPDWGQIVVGATGTRRTSRLPEADVVVALRLPTPAEIASLRTGDVHAPERGARLIVACTGFAPAATPGVNVRVSGPGASRHQSIRLGGVTAAVIAALAAVNGGHPAGVDTWFVAPNGSMVALPRSATLELTDPPEARRTPRRTGAWTNTDGGAHRALRTREIR